MHDRRRFAPRALALLGAALLMTTLATGSTGTPSVFDRSDTSSGSATPPGADPGADPALVAAFGIDEAAGADVLDASGNGHDGTLAGGAVRIADGYFGRAVDLSGAGGRIDLGAGLDVAGDGLTISLWFRASGFVVEDGRLISKANGTAEQDHYWMISTIGGPHLRFRLKTDSGGTATLTGTGATLTAGDWTHVAATYDGTWMRLYQNGILVGNLAKTGALSTNPTVLAWIGDNPGGGRPFDGTVDEVRIYSRALDPGEILADMGLPVGELATDDENPGPPTNPTGSALSSGSVRLSWQAATDNTGVAGYRVYRDGGEIDTTVTAPYTDTGLAASTFYRYELTAYDAAGNESIPSTPVDVRTLDPDTTAPSAPDGLTATAVSATRIDLAWQPSSDAVGVAGYRVGRDGAQIAEISATSYADEGLAPGSTHEYTVVAFDGENNVSAPSDPAAATTGGDPRATVIDVWYGSHQQFGNPGNPQRWVNVLGDVSDPDGVASLAFSLNDGPLRTLSIGPDERRLYHPGDFVVEIDFAQLLDGTNTVRLRAVDGTADVTERTVTVEYAAGNVWPRDYSIVWDDVGALQDAVDVVDGEWELTPGGLHVVAPAYDRLLAIGDVGWDDYEVVVPFTVHALDPDGFGGRSGQPGLGLIMRWTGHTDTPAVCAQPHCGWLPHGKSAWYWWDYTGGEPGNIGGPGSLADPSGALLEFGLPYVFKMRVETVPGTGHYYRHKIWSATETEPHAWTAGDWGDPGVPFGSQLIVAHHVEATFGDIRVSPLPDNESPGAPPGLAADPVSASRVELTWPPATDNLQVTGYRIVRDGATVATTNLTTFLDLGLSPQSEYLYRVAALDDSGNESDPASAAALTLPLASGTTCEDEWAGGTPPGAADPIGAAGATCYLYRIEVDCHGKSSGAAATLKDVDRADLRRALFVLYDTDGPDGEPSTLLASSLAFHDPDSLGEPLTFSVPWIAAPTLSPGAYWAGVCLQSEVSEYYSAGLTGGTVRRDAMTDWPSGPHSTWRHESDAHPPGGDLALRIEFDGTCPGCAPATCGDASHYAAPCSDGLGACRADGAFICDDAGSAVEAPYCDAVPGSPAAETCDGLDNDCDGETDEGYPGTGTACDVGVGACAAAGFMVCSLDGAGIECDATPSVPLPEVCDGADNDCDGEADEGLDCVLNVLTNGDFGEDRTGWKFYTDGVGSFSVVDGEARVAVTTQGTNVQLYQIELALQGATEYTLSFRGRNTSGNDVIVRLQQHSSPYTSYGLNATVDLDVTDQIFSIPFTTPAGDRTDGRFVFWMGADDADGDEYVFDDVVIRRTASRCGDGLVQSGEACDDGNTVGGDGCESDCTLPVSAAENLIDNGDFAGGTFPWSFHTNGAGSYTVTGGEARIAIAAAGTNVQLYQRGVILEGGTTYRLTLRGRHTTGRDVTVRLHQHLDPYTNYGLDETFDLDTSMGEFSATFTTPGGSPGEARFGFWMAPFDEDGADWYFDDVVLEQVP